MKVCKDESWQVASLQVASDKSASWQDGKAVTMDIMHGIPGFEEWAAKVAQALRDDPLWQFQVYPKALYFYEFAWQDCGLLTPDPRGRAIAQQMIRSAGSISANIEEGFGRGFGNDYAYHLRVAMAEARETRGWYWRAHHILPDDLIRHRMSMTSEIIAMLIPNIQRQRKYRKR